MNSPSCVAYYHPTLPIDLLEVNRRLRECLTSTGPQVRVKPPDSASIGTPAPYNVDDPCSELRWQVRLVEDEIKHFEDNMQDTLDYWQNRLDLTSNIHQLMQAHQRKFRTDGRWYETAENSGVASLSEGQHSNGNQEPRVCATKASACSPWKREHDQIDASGGPSAMPMQKRARMEESTSVVAAYLTNQQTTPSTASETTAEFPPKSSIAEYEGSSILGSSSQMKMMVEPGQGLVDELKGQWWKVADSVAQHGLKRKWHDDTFLPQIEPTQSSAKRQRLKDGNATPNDHSLESGERVVQDGQAPAQVMAGIT